LRADRDRAGKGLFRGRGLGAQAHLLRGASAGCRCRGVGDLDFGDAAHTAALYNLDAAGRVRIIASGASEAPSFHALAIVASNQAYAAGLKSPHDLPGHSYALTQMGTGLQYNLGRIATHEQFDANTVTLLPLQSNPNIASALSGGRADAATFDSTNAIPLIQKGEVKLIGWVGDLTGYTPTFFMFASQDMVEHHGDTVRRFLVAYRKATEEYYRAFTDAHGLRHDEPTSPAILDIIATWIGQSPERVKLGLPYFDREARVDMAAVQDQLDWYRSIGAIKESLLAANVVDKRFAVERPEARAAVH
jgi:NitT/TauT family transport system substrate-binding protein